jgi:hypothetical protein
MQDMKPDNARITPEYVTSLEPGSIFVFGSNRRGRHWGGAAHMANKKFGAEWGVGVGRTGQTYAIPTMDGDIEAIRSAVDDFIKYAGEHPELFFYVTPIGCGIAGWHPDEIAPLFEKAAMLENVSLPASFWDILK